MSPRATHAERVAIHGQEYFREKNRRHTQKLKREVIDAYGGRCSCCGELEIVFLTIDHINGGGKKQRSEVGGFGKKFYLWLKRNNYPKDEFQVLCLNCNFAKGKTGRICPHQLQYRSQPE